jgi:hypothetical protein
LRGSRDPNGDGEAWNSTVALPGARECTVWIYRDRSLGQSVFCEMGHSTDISDMESKFPQVVADIREALPSGWTVSRTVPNKRTVFRKGSSGPTVEVVIRESRSGISRVLVDISPED